MRFTSWRRCILFGLVAVLTIGLAGNAGWAAAQTKMMLKLWHTETPPERVKAFQWVIDQFEKENPNVQIEQQSMSWDVCHPKILSAINVGAPPDMCWLSPTYLTTIYRTGALRPVDDIVDAVDKEYTYIKQQMKVYRWDGHFWAVPAMSIVQTLIYREDLLKEAGFSQPPATWDELLKTAQALTKGGRYGIGIPTASNLFTDQMLYNFMATAGADLIDAKGNVVFDSEETVAALEFYRSLAKFSPPDSTVWTWAESDQALATERCAMVINYGCSLAPFVTQHPDKVKYLKVVGVPVPKGGKPGATTSTLGVGVLTNDPARYEMVKKFLIFLMRPDINGALASNAAPGLFLPITEKGRVSKSFWEHPIVSQVRAAVDAQIEQLRYATVIGFASGAPHMKVGDVIGAHILAQTVQQVVVKGMSPKEAAKWGAAKMKEIIDKP